MLSDGGEDTAIPVRRPGIAARASRWKRMIITSAYKWLFGAEVVDGIAAGYLKGVEADHGNYNH